jgi:hypothetical protein
LIGDPSTIFWRMDIIKLLSMQFPLVSFYFLSLSLSLSLRPSCVSQPHILEQL